MTQNEFRFLQSRSAKEAMYKRLIYALGYFAILLEVIVNSVSCREFLAKYTIRPVCGLSCCLNSFATFDSNHVRLFLLLQLYH